MDFTPSKYLKKVRDAIIPEFSFSAASEPEFSIWRGKLKEILTRVLGGFPKMKQELRSTHLERVDMPLYVREKVFIESDSGCYVPMYVFVPKKGTAPFPALLAIHGHGRGMKDTAGVFDTKEAEEAVRETNHDYGRQFAERGYMVFAPEMIGFGERREKEDKALPNNPHSCRITTFHSMIIGKTVIGMRVWDVMRVIDYAHTRPECDAKKRLGCVGLSGGGTVTMYATALDTRITCAVISGYFNTFEDSILAMPHCDCNYIPGIRRYAEMSDIASMIAPRPLLIESGTKDEIFPVEATKKAYNRLQQAYRILEADERLDIDIFEGNHRFSGAKAFGWMDKWTAKKN